MCRTTQNQLTSSIKNYESFICHSSMSVNVQPSELQRLSFVVNVPGENSRA